MNRTCFALRRRDLLAAGLLGLAPLRGWAGEFAYRGWRFDTSVTQDQLSADLVRSLQAQVDIVESVNLKPHIKGFFQHVPKTIDPDTHHGGGLYDFNDHCMYLSTAIDAPDNPVLLHELIHAYHDQRMPGGVNNDMVADWFEHANRTGLFPADSYMMTNGREFFAMCVSVVLWGVAARPPSTREKVREAFPYIYDWVVTEFTAGALAAAAT
jgi:hypothetical protein